MSRFRIPTNAKKNHRRTTDRSRRRNCLVHPRLEGLEQRVMMHGDHLGDELATDISPVQPQQFRSSLMSRYLSLCKSVCSFLIDGSQKKRRRTRRGIQNRLVRSVKSVETLEPRQMMAVATLGSDHVLRIVGTERADESKFARNPAACQSRTHRYS